MLDILTQVPKGFLDAMVADPDDLTVRLVYADWLAEQFADDKAEYVRVQCEIFRKRAVVLEDLDADELCKVYAELTVAYARQSTLEMEANGRTDWWPESFWDAHNTAVRMRQAFEIEFTRGCVGTVHCSLEIWMAYGRRMVADAPILRVRIVGKSPDVSHCMFGWRRWTFGSETRLGDRGKLPVCLRQFMPEPVAKSGQRVFHYERQDARSALSQAVLALARSDVKLRPRWAAEKLEEVAWASLDQRNEGVE